MSDELTKSAGQWWGDAFTKVAVGLLSLAATGAAVWMLSIHTQLATLNVKLDHMSATHAETKKVSIDALAASRDNARRLDRVEATRFTAGDAEKMISPLEFRLNALEKRRR